MSKLTYTTSAFSETCPDCGAAIQYVQFGGPRIGYDEYPGFQFVKYACRADYYFDDRKPVVGIDGVRCPSTLPKCKLCGNLYGSLTCSDHTGKRLAPFCSDKCAIAWAVANAPKPATEKKE